MIIQILETDLFRLIFPFRSGSRSICAKFETEHGKNYLDFSQLNEYLDNKKNNILLLRKPKDRFVSGYRIAQTLKTNKKGYLSDYSLMLSLHAEPYINKINTEIKFSYILFEELSSYGFEHIGSNTKTGKFRRTWEKEFDDIYDLADEQKAYDNFIQQNEKLDSEIFHKWFLDSRYINAKECKLSHLKYEPLKLSGE